MFRARQFSLDRSDLMIRPLLRAIMPRAAALETKNTLSRLARISSRHVSSG